VEVAGVDAGVTEDFLNSGEMAGARTSGESRTKHRAGGATDVGDTALAALRCQPVINASA